MGRGCRTGWMIIALAAAVRLAALLVVPAPAFSGDAVDYDRLARSLVAGKGYVAETGQPTAERPPLYALLVAGIYAVFGPHAGTVLVIQALLDAGNCGLIWAVGRRLAGEPAGGIAGVLASLHATFIGASRLLISETLGLFWLLLGFWCLLRLLDRPSMRWIAALGTTLGLSILTRGITLLLPIACLAPFVRSWGWRPAVRRWALLLAVVTAVLAPWAIRNWRVFHEVVPVATQIGHTLYSSYRPPEGKGFGYYTEDETVAAAKARLSEPEASRYLARETLNYLRQEPGVIPRLTLMKLGLFLAPIDWELLGGGQGVWNPTYAFILPFALLGMWAAAPMGADTRWLWWFAGYFVLMAAVFYGSPRLRLPVEAPLLVWAGIGGAWLWRRFRGRIGVISAATAAYLGANVWLISASGSVKHLLASLAGRAGLW